MSELFRCDRCGVVDDVRTVIEKIPNGLATRSDLNRLGATELCDSCKTAFDAWVKIGVPGVPPFTTTDGYEPDH